MGSARDQRTAGGGVLLKKGLNLKALWITDPWFHGMVHGRRQQIQSTLPHGGAFFESMAQPRQGEAKYLPKTQSRDNRSN